jgi:2-hydroxychromene-2-carboxylate isomerase
MTATFYYDLMSPYAYLAAERLERVLPDDPPAWQPVLLGGLFKLTGRSSWALGDYERRARGMAEIERRASEHGLPPLRWPDPWPTSSLAAMRVAIHARHAGREREYAAAAFRTAFGQGLDLGELSNVLVAAKAGGLDPSEAEAAVADPSVKEELRSETDAAHARGVFGVPTVAVGRGLFWGDDRLEDAAAALARDRASG